MRLSLIRHDGTNPYTGKFYRNGQLLVRVEFKTTGEIREGAPIPIVRSLLDDSIGYYVRAIIHRIGR